MCWLTVLITIDAIPVRSSTYGNGTSPILLDNLICDGSENNLTECKHNGLGVSNCGPSEIAGVICNGKSCGCGLCLSHDMYTSLMVTV